MSFAQTKPQVRLELDRSVFSRPAVLVVDDELSLLDATARNVISLGWPCDRAANVSEAFRVLRENSDIGIILADVYIGNEHGLRMLERILEEFPERPFSCIVTSGLATLEMAISAIQQEVVDFLPKPFTLVNLERALQRAEVAFLEAKRRHSAQRATLLPVLLSQLNDIVDSLAAAQAATAPQSSWDTAELGARLERLIEARQARKRYFPGIDLSDPNWDIILDVAAGQIARRTVPVSNACLAAGVSMTTALRCVRDLVNKGWLVRWTDPADRRRDLLGVSPLAMESLRDYVSSLNS